MTPTTPPDNTRNPFTLADAFRSVMGRNAKGEYVAKPDAMFTQFDLYFLKKLRISSE